MNIRTEREFPGSPIVRTLQTSLLWASVQSLVGELRSHKLQGAAKKEEDNLEKRLTLDEN